MSNSKRGPGARRTGVFSLEHYLASRTLLWAGHVARRHKNRLPKRLMLSWVPEPRDAGGQEMTNGRSLQRHLAHFNLPTASTEWAPLTGPRRVAQARDRAPLQTCYALRATTKRRHQDNPDKEHLAEQRTAEIAKRRADFNATNN